jgi:hypothetical protein
MTSLRVLVLVAVFGATARADDGVERWMRGLDLTFGTDGVVPPTQGDQPAERAARIVAFVRSRMAQNAFYDHVLPKLFEAMGPKHQPMAPEARALVQERSRDRPYYHLPDDGPCPRSEQVSVRPWWDLGHPVWVCQKSYRPEIKQEPSIGGPTGQAIFCEGSAAENQCRCGEHLMNCTRDEEQRRKVLAALDAEPIRTVQRVVQERRPFSDIFVRNETVRSDYAELYYARNRFFKTGELKLPRVLSEEATPRPRDPEFGGGVLSVPVYLYFDDAYRIVVATIWNDFLCTPLNSRSVKAELLFGSTLTTTRLRFHASMELAKMPVCRDCHARLDNAMEAFMPFTSVFAGMRHEPSGQYNDPIAFYMRDANDARGQGPATVQWLGEMIAKQPEQAACIVNKVEALVYGGYPVPAAVDVQLKQDFARSQDFMALMEATMLARQQLGAVPVAR